MANFWSIYLFQSNVRNRMDSSPIRRIVILSTFAPLAKLIGWTVPKVFPTTQLFLSAIGAPTSIARPTKIWKRRHHPPELANVTSCLTIQRNYFINNSILTSRLPRTKRTIRQSCRLFVILFVLVQSSLFDEMPGYPQLQFRTWNLRLELQCWLQWLIDSLAFAFHVNSNKAMEYFAEMSLVV